MSKATIIKDKISGTPFAVIFGTGERLKAFGALGQGKVWASWIMNYPGSLDPLLNLDVSLVAEEERDLSTDLINTIAPSFDVFDLDGIRAIAQKSPLLIIRDTKSADEKIPEKYKKINDDNEKEEIVNLPISDISLASLDISYKKIAVNYKAKAFFLDINKSSLLLQVKGARAMWDPNMPGGGGWRCPDSTPYGGQFTNRLGSGCTFGVARRIGKKLMTSSLKDITDGDTQNNLKFPTVYKAGKKLESVGRAQDLSKRENQARRAQRRAQSLDKIKSRRMMAAAKPTFEQRSESLRVEGFSRKNRIRIAALQSARDILDDRVTEGFVAQARRNRRQGRTKDKSPKNSSNETTGRMANSISSTPGDNNRERREKIAQRLRNASDSILAGRRSSRRKNRQTKKPNSEISNTSSSDTLVSRFFNGESSGLNRIVTDTEREIRGLSPRSTDTRRTRIAKRQRRRAKAENEEKAQLSDYPEYAKSKINPPALPGNRSRKYKGRIGVIGAGERLTADVGYKKTKSRFVIETDNDSIDNILSGIVNDLEEGIDATPITGDTTKGLDSLDKFLHYEMSHIGIALARASALNEFDLANQDNLREIYREWLTSLNNSNEDTIPGMPSNMGLTSQVSKIIVGPNEPSFRNPDVLAEVKSKLNQSSVPGPPTVGERNVLRATNTIGEPIVYIEDTDAAVAHVMTTDGRHLLTMLTKNPASKNNKDSELLFIAGESSYEQIIERQIKPTLADKFFRGTRQRTSTASLDKIRKPAEETKRQWAFLKSDDDGFVDSKTQIGRHLSAMTTVVGENKEATELLLREINTEIESLDKKLRGNLNFPIINEPIDIQEATNKIDEIAKTNSRRAGILKNDLHNFVALAKALKTDDPLYINDLKPQLREKILKVLVESGFDRLVLGGSATSRRTFVRHDVIRALFQKQTPSSEFKPEIKKLASRPPILTEKFEVPEFVEAVSTGPELVDGVGNINLGIEFDSRFNLYRDTATGEYIEDLSNLQIKRASIYQEVVPYAPDARSYPTVQISPVGVFPTQYVTLAPDADLTIFDEKSMVARTFKDAIDAYAFAEVLKNSGKAPDNVGFGISTRFKETSKAVAKIKSNILVRINATGYRGKLDSLLNLTSSGGKLIYGKDFFRNYGFPPLDIPLDELQGFAENSVTERPDLPLGTLGTSYPRNIEGTNLSDLPHGYTDVKNFDFSKNSPPNGPFVPSIFYLPSELLIDNSNSSVEIGNEPSVPAYVQSINKALTLQNRQDLLESMSLPEDMLAVNREDSVEAWSEAATELSETFKNASLIKYNALVELQQNPKNKGAMLDYLTNGQIAENAKMLLENHIVSNPNALRAIRKKTQLNLEAKAKALNIKQRQDAERLARRENRGLPRSEGAFDGNPEILDPHGTNTPPLVPRTLGTIIDLSEQHKAEGLFDNPIPRPTDFTEEQINALAAMQELRNKASDARNGNGDGMSATTFTGLPGTPMYGTGDYAPDSETVADVAVAHFWFYNGASSLPVLASEEELIEALGEEILSVDGSRSMPAAVAMARGLRGNDAATNRDYVNQALRGDRFIVGQGGRMAGRGEYWSVSPGAFSSFHGTDGTILGIITHKTKIFHRDIFNELFPSSNGEMYETLWGFYNAIGAPGSQGVNSTHGKSVASLIGVNSILPDPSTNQFTQTQIDKMIDVAAQLTLQTGFIVPIRKPTKNSEYPSLNIEDTWGSLTIEGLVRDNKIKSSIRFNIFDDIYKPNEAHAAETKELRENLNAWYSQHLSWFIQLAQLRRDESQSGQEGLDAKLYNQKLTDATRSLIYLPYESRASMLGIDALFVGLTRENNLLQSKLYENIATNTTFASSQEIILILNRSAMIYNRTHSDGYKSFAAKVKNKFKTANPLQDRNWGRY